MGIQREQLYRFPWSKTVEIVHAFYHMFKGRYCAFLKKSAAGKKMLLLVLFDQQVKKTFINYLKACIRNPLRLLYKIYIQSIHLQQPNEIIDGKKISVTTVRI